MEASHHAVCCEILNLLSQGGFRPTSSALAQAYRVTDADRGTHLKSVGSKPEVHEDQGAGFIYEIIPVSTV
jgi:hypothetical protein